MTNDLRIADAPLLVDVSGEEKLPTGGYGNYSATINQIADFTQLKWKLATEGYVNNEINVVTNKLNTHTQDKTNPHGVTKEQVGLGEVDNTADLDKPVSAYQRTAIDEKIAKTSIVDNLTTNETSKVLSAKQGKILQDTKANKSDVEVSLGLKADKSEVYTKDETLTLQREDRFVITESGRTQREKNKDSLNIKDYGAKVDGVTIDNDAIVKMYNDVGYVVFPAGNTLLTSIDLTGDLYFDAFASIVAENDSVIGVKARIHAPNQYIFKGDGQYNLDVNREVGESYEECKVVRSEWWGVFPTNDTLANQSPLIQKIHDSLGNVRESVIDFSNGNFQLNSEILTSRGAWTRGAGLRRTVFKTRTGGYDLFKTNNTACRFSNFQFEHASSLLNREGGAYININHTDCEVFDVGVYPSDTAISVNGDNAQISDIRITHGQPSNVGSSTILVNANNCKISGVRALTSQYGAESIVKISPSAKNISGVQVMDIQYNTPSTAVLIQAHSSFNVSKVTVDGITQTGTATTVESIVKLETISSGGIYDSNISNIISNGTYESAVSIDAKVGNVSGVTLDEITDQRSTGSPIKLRRTSGVIDNLIIGKVNARNVSKIVDSVGASISYKIESVSEKSITNPKTYDLTIETNKVSELNFHSQMFACNILFSATAGSVLHYGSAVARMASTPVVNGISSSSNVVYTNTNLTGETGVSGNITISCQNGKIQIENRTGTSLRMSLTISSGQIV